MSDYNEELPDHIYDKVQLLSQTGQELFKDGKNLAAIQEWQKALKLLPEPRNKWEAALWLYAALGDAYRTDGNLDDALTNFQSAYATADGYLNPYILFSLGATLYDLGEKEEATDYLLQAYMLEGEKIFDNEDDGEQYLEYLRIKKLIK